MTEIEAQAAADVKAWLTQHPETVSVDDVRSDPGQQQRGIDYLWQTSQATYTIAVTADRWEEAGQFFFEMQADEEQEIAGSFFTTTAQFVFYCFVVSTVLYILPMPDTREWFAPRAETFQERRTTTPTADGGYSVTTGRLIPIGTVLAAVPNIEEVQL